jgi:hypothetical protein
LAFARSSLILANNFLPLSAALGVFQMKFDYRYIVTFIVILWSSIGSAKQQSTIRDLTQNEVKVMGEAKQWGNDIFVHYAKGRDINASNLDFVYQAWVKDSTADKFENRKIMYGLGVIYGNLVTSNIDSKWQVIIDQYGAGFTVLLSGGSKIFPVDMVAKRVKGGNKEFGFFKAHFDLMKNISAQVQ